LRQKTPRVYEMLIADLNSILGGLARATRLSPVIVCLYEAGAMPAFASPMRRDPSPPIERRVGSDLAEAILDAVLINCAVHDGAIMIAKHSDGSLQITGWSYRLFPPDVDQVVPANRGSAFNSCFAMSFVKGVFGVYLSSEDGSWLFEEGRISKLNVIANVPGEA
jgi:hypothetical protein